MGFNTSAFFDVFKRYDFSFFGICSAIFFIGILNLYSATQGSPHMAGLYKTQLAYFGLAVLVGMAVSFFGPKNLYRYSYAFYFFNIFLLLVVLFLGHKGMGAQRWLVLGPIRFQPSEIMKLSVVLSLARWWSKHDVDRDLGLKELIIPFGMSFAPALLIMMEPDLGTGLLILLIFFVMAFYRKLKWKTLVIIAVIGTMSGVVMYNFGLKDYQRRRILTFIDPGADVRGSGYNAIQSKIAIGSGQFWGKGWQKSTQASLNYLPENHTDFVFSNYNEEHGFVGALILISLYLVLFFRFLWLASSVTRLFDAVIAVGLMAIFFWHTFVNMGMVMGLVPVVGLPLPLMSYGGSSLMTFGICCGVATSISNSRNLF